MLWRMAFYFFQMSVTLSTKLSDYTIYLWLYYACVTWVLIFVYCFHPLDPDWNPVGKDMLLFTFDMISIVGSQKNWRIHYWVKEWMSQYKWKVYKVDYFKEDNTHFISVKHLFSFKKIFKFIIVIKINWKCIILELYNFPWSKKAVPGIAKPLNITGFPLQVRILSLFTVVFPNDDQGNVKVVESKVNLYPPRITACSSCLSLKIKY